jgi:hypothetical protein
MNSFLSKFRILDTNGVLSLTNIALMATIVKMCVSPATSVSDWLALATTVGGYQFKRWHDSRQTNTQVFESRLASLESNISAIKSGLALKR